jgi:beta-barrel assembly-enhancing protease
MSSLNDTGAARLGGIPRAWLGALIAALIILGGAGCSKGSLLSTKDEVNIGKRAVEQIAKNYRVDTTSKDAERVRRIGERVVLHSDQRPGVPYSFRVIDEKDVNAISLPGGPIYVFRGLLDLVGDDDDALATILAHEIGHTNGRHIARQYTKQFEANILLGILLSATGANRTTSQLAGTGLEILGYKFSRDDEYDADRRGLSYAHKAGFDPHGMTRFFEKMKTLDKSGGGTPEFLRTHPVTSSRIDRARKIIETQEYKYGQ